jgi:hypothetical protein
MGRGLIRGILNSARGVSDKDNSPEAQARRRISGFGDLDGVEFVARIDIGTDTNGEDKNEIRAAVTPDHRDYAALMGHGRAAGLRRPGAGPRPAAAHHGQPAQPARVRPRRRRSAELGAVRGNRPCACAPPEDLRRAQRGCARLPRQHAGRGAHGCWQDHHALGGHRRDDRRRRKGPACSRIVTS